MSTSLKLNNTDFKDHHFVSSTRFDITWPTWVISFPKMLLLLIMQYYLFSFSSCVGFQRWCLLPFALSGSWSVPGVPWTSAGLGFSVKAGSGKSSTRCFLWTPGVCGKSTWRRTQFRPERRCDRTGHGYLHYLDFSLVWTVLSFEQELNRRLRAPIEAFFSHLVAVVTPCLTESGRSQGEEAQVTLQQQWDGHMTLRLKSELAGLPFYWEFHCSPAPVTTVTAPSMSLRQPHSLRSRVLV